MIHILYISIRSITPLDQSSTHSHTSLCRPYQWKGAGSPPETVQSVYNRKLFEEMDWKWFEPSDTVHSEFGWEKDLVLIRTHYDDLSVDIGKFVFGDIPRITHPRGVVETLGGTLGATFAFADNIIGLDERTAIRNVVDAAYLRYVTQGVANHFTQGVRQDSR